MVKTADEVERMRIAGRILAGVHARAAELVRPGITTGALDQELEAYIIAHGAQPAFKGYRSYPASICASVNEEVVHGIPGNRILEDGDILGLDVGVLYDGYYADAAVTLPVGTISDEARRLLDTTREALYAGLEKARAGNHLSDISHAIQTRVERDGYSVVRELVGHGIGKQMHEDPQVPNYGKAGRGPKLRAGMALAIEPMVNMGEAAVVTMPDGWTVATKDGSLSAHFEHTVVITESAPEILTAGPNAVPAGDPRT